MTNIERETGNDAQQPQWARKAWTAAVIGMLGVLTICWFTVAGERTLFYAIRSDKVALARLSLALFVNPNADDGGDSALALASFCSPDLVRLLISKGANPRRGGRLVPLRAIAKCSRCPSGVQIVDMLASAGADFKACDEVGAPLEEVQSIEVAAAMIKHGADPNQTCSPDSPAPLFSAVERPKILALLLDSGAKIGLDPRNKVTPLHLAAYLGAKDYQTQVPQRLESAEILLAHGADVNAVDQDGMTPMDCAYEKSDKEMIALLAKHGGKAKKYANAKPSEDAQDPESEYHELYDVAEGVRKGPACSLSVRGDNKAIMEEGDNWSIIRGTVGVVSVNCRAPGYFHYAVLGMGAPVPKKLNMPLSGGMPSSARIKFDKVWNNGEMRWYYSRERVTDLVRALNRGDATHFAMRLVNVGDE